MPVDPLVLPPDVDPPLVDPPEVDPEVDVPLLLLPPLLLAVPPSAAAPSNVPKSWVHATTMPKHIVSDARPKMVVRIRTLLPVLRSFRV